jgi:hypothetical protein
MNVLGRARVVLPKGEARDERNKTNEKIFKYNVLSAEGADVKQKKK